MKTSPVDQRPWDEKTRGAYDAMTTPAEKRRLALHAAAFYGDDRDGLREALAMLDLDRLPVGGKR